MEYSSKNDIQFTVRNNNINIITTMILAFLLQLLNIIINMNQQDLGLMDFYVLSNVSDAISIINVIGWGIPLFVAFLCGQQFYYFNDVKTTVFTRTRQDLFIYKRAIRSFWMSVWYLLLFYVFSFIFLVIIMMIINPELNWGVSYINRSMLNSALYFNQPYLYVLFYIICSSLFGGVFSLMGFLTSLYFNNKALIFLMPFTIMVLMIFVFESNPILNIFNYNNTVLLNLTMNYQIPSIIYAMGKIGSILLYMGVLSLLIYRKGKKDLV
ncbi:MAG: hypothetical protein RR578_02610 [Bacilli bacterium]